MVVAKSQLAEAEGRIVQARGALKQAEDELAAREEVQRRSPGSVAARDVERVRVQVDTQQGALDAALASRAGRRVGDGVPAPGPEGERRGGAA